MHLILLTGNESPGIYIFAWKIYRIIGIGQRGQWRILMQTAAGWCKLVFQYKY